MMIVTILVDDAMTNNMLVDFLSGYDYDLLTRKSSFLDCVFTCTPNRDTAPTPYDLAFEMETWMHVKAEVIDVEYE